MELSENPTPQEVLKFYDLHTTEGAVNFSNADEGLSILLWHSLAQLEAELDGMEQAWDDVMERERVALEQIAILKAENARVLNVLANKNPESGWAQVLGERQNIRELEAKLEAIECGECEKSMLHCRCDEESE